jgi:hypothetical protein
MGQGEMEILNGRIKQAQTALLAIEEQYLRKKEDVLALYSPTRNN